MLALTGRSWVPTLGPFVTFLCRCRSFKAAKSEGFWGGSGCQAFNWGLPSWVTKDVMDVDYVAWQADHDAYGFSGQMLGLANPKPSVSGIVRELGSRSRSTYRGSALIGLGPGSCRQCLADDLHIFIAAHEGTASAKLHKKCQVDVVDLVWFRKCSAQSMLFMHEMLGSAANELRRQQNNIEPDHIFLFSCKEDPLGNFWSLNWGMKILGNFNGINAPQELDKARGPPGLMTFWMDIWWYLRHFEIANWIITDRDLRIVPLHGDDCCLAMNLGFAARMLGNQTKHFDFWQLVCYIYIYRCYNNSWIGCCSRTSQTI